MLGPVRTWIESPTASVSEDGAFRVRLPAGGVYTYGFSLESDQVLVATRKGPLGSVHEVQLTPPVVDAAG